MSEAKPIGRIVHYFNKLGVAVVAVTDGQLKIGDQIKIVGAARQVEQTVESLQVERQAVTTVKAGEEAGLKVAEPVREGDEVYLV